jgi:hypothetical protein
MKNAIILIALILSINPVFGQKRIGPSMSEPAEPQAIELIEVHNMVKNLADSIKANYIIGEKAVMLKEKLLKELNEGKFDSYTDK